MRQGRLIEARVDSVSQVIKNAMTVDVEDYFHVASLSQSIDRSSWGRLETRVRENNDILLDAFDQAGVSATFFVLGWVAEKHPEIVTAICERGHELACHGYSHKLIYEQSRGEFAEEARKAKAILEDLSGRTVKGYRAASYSITDKSLWAIEELLAAGFEYDSSIVPVRHDYYGLPDAKPYPYRIAMPDGQLLTEFPPATIELLGKRISIAGGGYFRIFPYWFSRWGMRSLNRTHRVPFSFYIHPWEVDPEQPRVNTSAKSAFRHYTNLEKCRDRLLRLLKDFEFTTMSDVLDEMDLEHHSFERLHSG